MKLNLLIPLLSPATMVFLAVNLLMVPWSHHLLYAKKLSAIRSAQHPNLLFIGNSLLDGHLDEAQFSAAARVCNVSLVPVNAALGAVQPPEQRLLYQYATDRHSGVRTLVVGFFDFQLTRTDNPEPMDLTGNQMVAIDRSVPIKEVTEAYQFNRYQEAEVERLRFLPVVVNRANAWRNVELLRRRMQQVGMPPVAKNNLGRIQDFAALEPISVQEFDRNTEDFVRDPNRRFNRSFEFIFDQAEAAGMRAVLLVMPISPMHYALFYERLSWHRYLDAVKEVARRRKIEVIDASDWLPERRYFGDGLHMEPVGVTAFSKRLGQTLACSGARDNSSAGARTDNQAY